jgi:acetylglutamate kinase
MRLNRHGQPSVGLSGDDGQLFRVSTMEGPGGEDIGFVGKVERVDANVIHHIAADYIPVIASVGADAEGNSYNVNADTAAGAIAEAMRAYKVVFLTDIDGWLDDNGQRISQASAAEVRERLPSVTGGMRPKLEACVHALESGVENAHIIDGRRAHSLLLELFTDEGIGTKLWG